MKVRCLHTLDELFALRTQINALNLASSSPDPFSTFEYYQNVVNGDPAFVDGGAALWFLAAFVDECLIGYLALRMTERRVWWRRSRTLEFLVGHDTDRPHVVARELDRPAATDAFYLYLTSRPDWDLLELQQQTAASSLDAPPAEIKKRGFRIAAWPTMRNYTIRNRWPNFEAYVGSLDRKFRSETKRKMRKLFSAGEVALLSSSDPTCTDALFDLYRAVESQSWKSKTRLTVGDARRAVFVRGLLSASQPMRIVIHILLLNGMPIAGLISGSFADLSRRQLFALHMAFDERFAALSPGSAILMLGIRHAIDNKYSNYNLLSGFGYYKTQLQAVETATRSIQIFRSWSAIDCRRRLGDVVRLIARRGAQEEGLRFRGGHAKADSLQAPASLAWSRAERAYIEGLVARVRRGGHEYLSRQELARLLPFDIDPPSHPKQIAKSRAIRAEDGDRNDVRHGEASPLLNPPPLRAADRSVAI